MLKPIPGRESLRHICDNLIAKHQELEIYRHDGQPHAIIKNPKNGSAWAGNIKYCPYCGVEIEKEESSC